MKTTFITPNIKIVYLSDCDLIATSDPQVEFGGGDKNPDEARERRNPIWDDYE